MSDKEMMGWLEKYCVSVRDEKGALVFFRCQGARPLREYVAETSAEFMRDAGATTR